MRRPTNVFCLLLLFLLVSLTASSQSPDLKQYSTCPNAGRFSIYRADRLPNTMIRTVDTTTGPKEVKLVDGYRVLVLYDKDEAFVNLKAEQLDPATFPNEKAILLDSLSYTAQNTPNMDSMMPKRKIVGGTEVYGIDRKALEGGTLSIYNFFDDKAAQMVTIYFLNDKPEQRKFKTIEEYYKLRDEFLANYIACVHPPSQSPKTK